MINDIGLFFNIIGTILIAYSFSMLDSNDFGAGGSTPDAKGIEREFSYFSHPKCFKFGIGLIFIGFIIQLSFVQTVLLKLIST